MPVCMELQRSGGRRARMSSEECLDSNGTEGSMIHKLHKRTNIPTQAYAQRSGSYQFLLRRIMCCHYVSAARVQSPISHDLSHEA